MLIEHNGMRLPAREWGRRSGVDYRTILRRIRRGLPPSEAMRLVACELTLRKPYASLPTQEPRHT